MNVTETYVSNPPEVASGWRAVPSYTVAYFVQGLLMFVCNALVATTIARTPALHFKGYVMLAALASADALLGVAYFACGTWRSWLFYWGEAGRPVTVASCLLVPGATLLILAEPLATLMLVCVSLDRMIAVGWPKKYVLHLTTAGYTRPLIGAFVAVSLGISAAMIASSFATDGLNVRTTAICLASRTVNSKLGQVVFYGLRVPGGLASVLLYVPVPFLYRRERQKMAGVRRDDQVAELNRQRRLATTVGMSVLCTLVFFVTPNVYRSASVWFDLPLTAAMRQYMSVIQNVNPLFNICIYFKRQRDIREAMLRMFGIHPPAVQQVTSVSVQRTRTK